MDRLIPPFMGLGIRTASTPSWCYPQTGEEPTELCNMQTTNCSDPKCPAVTFYTGATHVAITRVTI